MAAMTHVAGDRELRAGHRHRARAAALVRRAELHAQAGEAELAVLAFQLDRGDEELDLDALRLGGLDFLHQAGHLASGPAVEHAHGLGAQAHGAAAGVHRRVAAADDHDVACRHRVAGHR